MYLNKAQIFNIALNTIGVSVPIEKANSEDNRFVLLNNYYELARDYVLKDFDWNFASTFKTLSLSDIEINSALPYEYRYCYTYPNNCISAKNVFSKGSYILEKFYIHSLENYQKVILTNADNAILRYTRRITKENYFSPEFSMALAFYLASLTANAIVGSVQKGEAAFQKYRLLLKRAEMLNAQEGADYIYRDDTYINSRG